MNKHCKRCWTTSPFASSKTTMQLDGCWMTSAGFVAVFRIALHFDNIFVTFSRLLFIVPPQLLIPHQLVSVPHGFNVTLECFTEAHPTSLNYWTRGDSQMIHDGKKYHTENVPGTPPFKIHMKLTIFNVNDDDLVPYKCVAKNPRGETDGTIRIYGKLQKKFSSLEIRSFPFFIHIFFSTYIGSST